MSECSTWVRIDESRELARELLWIRACRKLDRISKLIEVSILKLRAKD